MDIGKIIKNKNTILSILKKIEGLRNKDFNKLKIEENKKESIVSNIIESSKKVIENVIVFVFAIFLFTSGFYICDGIFDFLFNGEYSGFTVFMWSTSLIILWLVVSNHYTQKNVTKEINKILDRKSIYENKILKEFSKHFYQYRNLYSEDRRDGIIDEGIINELIKKVDIFNEKEKKYIELEKNNNIINIELQKFKSESYEYIKNNYLTNREYSNLRELLNVLNIQIDEEKYNNIFELSKIKNKKSKMKKSIKDF